MAVVGKLTVVLPLAVGAVGVEVVGEVGEERL